MVMVLAPLTSSISAVEAEAVRASATTSSPANNNVFINPFMDTLQSCVNSGHVAPATLDRALKMNRLQVPRVVRLNGLAQMD